MRFLTLAVLSLSLLITFDAQAKDFNSLKDSIRSYRNLSNKPMAPDVTFENVKGETVTLADFKGKTVLLNLWATWCPPCVKEMPDLNELARDFKDKNFVVLVIATGRQGRETPDGFLQKRGLTDVVSYLDPKQKLLKVMEISSLPVSFIIAPDGTLQGGVIGITEWTAPKAKAALEKVLAE
ncbi:MAG: TlpA family protein disulfide reductase [Methylocystaceae bacterium]|nr:TlpA family protein disulfide reductase [Methylocystaceae bacterium]